MYVKSQNSKICNLYCLRRGLLNEFLIEVIFPLKSCFLIEMIFIQVIWLKKAVRNWTPEFETINFPNNQVSWNISPADSKLNSSIGLSRKEKLKICNFSKLEGAFCRAFLLEVIFYYREGFFGRDFFWLKWAFKWIMDQGKLPETRLPNTKQEIFYMIN